MPVDPIPEWVLQRRRAMGQRTRTARLDLELTQEQLAERVGLERKTINRLENGTYSPLVDHLLLVAHALGVDAADLLG